MVMHTVDHGSRTSAEAGLHGLGVALLGLEFGVEVSLEHLCKWRLGYQDDKRTRSERRCPSHLHLYIPAFMETRST